MKFSRSYNLLQDSLGFVGPSLLTYYSELNIEKHVIIKFRNILQAKIKAEYFLDQDRKLDPIASSQKLLIQL